MVINGINDNNECYHLVKWLTAIAMERSTMAIKNGTMENHGQIHHAINNGKPHLFYKWAIYTMANC